MSKITPEAAEAVLDGFSSQGFLFVDGHDFTQDEVDHFFELSKQFFALPQEVKQQTPIDGDDCGYTAYHQENLDPDPNAKGDPKEAFNVGKFDFTTGAFGRTNLPAMFADDANYKFVQTMVKKFYSLGITLLKLLAISLKIDEKEGGENWFSDRHRPGKKTITSMRMLHYPSTTELDAEQQNRCGAHTDYGSVTLLLQKQGQEGLEIFDKTSQWRKVPYTPSPNPEYVKQGKAAPVVVNIADILSYWTGGILKSTLHRVRLPTEGKDRYSIVFFFDAEDDTILEPIPSDLVRQARLKQVGDEFKKPNGEYTTAKEYSLKRFAETYKSGHGTDSK